MRSSLNPLTSWSESLFVVTWLFKKAEIPSSATILFNQPHFRLVKRLRCEMGFGKRKRGLRTVTVFFYEISIQPWIRNIHIVLSGLGLLTPHLGTRFWFCVIWPFSRFRFHRTGRCLDRLARGDLLTFCTWKYQDQTFCTWIYQDQKWKDCSIEVKTELSATFVSENP